MDWYYRCRKHIQDLEKRADNNFDHPSALDIPLCVENLKALVRGKTIMRPEYDFATHCRKDDCKKLIPGDIIIINGILVLQIEEILNLLDIKVYIDTDPDIRLQRRITRDIIDRGRKTEDVMQQWNKTVKIMHETFVEPSKKAADFIMLNTKSLFNNSSLLIF
jgi:uridine kinase